MQNKTTKARSRQALIVLGMHRSGTSALSGVLAKLGARTPATLMPPTPDNPRGYWESSALMRFHDDVLESAGARWSDWDRFNEDWIDSPVSRAFMDRLASLLEQEFSDADLFLVKDPRMCRLLPLWLNVLEEMEIVPKVVVPVRHPLEVFGSLARRDHITRMRAQLIWLRHNLDAESDSRGLARCFVRYADLLHDWRSVVSGISARLDLKWPRRSSVAEAEVEAYLAPELRHHVEPDGPMPGSSQIGTWIATAYGAIGALAGEGGEMEARSLLDRVREEFDRTSATYAPVMYEVRDSLEAKLGSEERQLAAVTHDLGELSAKHDLLQQENQANYDLAMSHKAALDDLREQYQNRENAHAILEAKCETLSEGIAREPEMHTAGIERISVEHQKQLADLAGELQSSQAARGLASTLESGFAEAIATKEREHDAAILDIENRHRVEMTEFGARLQAEIREIKAARQLAEESLQERFSEIAMLTTRVFNLEARVAEDATAASAARDRVARFEAELHAAKAGSRNLRLEIQAQAELAAEQRARLEKIHASRAWRLVGAVNRAIGRAPASGIEGEDTRPDTQLLRECKLFDQDWYNRRYPDVRARKMDPILHYLQYGAGEGRDPGPAFSTTGYCNRYPDVVVAGINPLVHYLKYGRKEGRIFSPMEEAIDLGSGERAAKD